MPKYNSTSYNNITDNNKETDPLCLILPIIINNQKEI